MSLSLLGPAVTPASPTKPLNGWKRIAFNGLGYYIGLAGLFVFAILVFGGWTHWGGWGRPPLHHSQREYYEIGHVQRVVYDHAQVLAFGGFCLSFGEAAFRRAKAGRGLLINLALLITYFFNFEFFVGGFRIK